MRQFYSDLHRLTGRQFHVFLPHGTPIRLYEAVAGSRYCVGISYIEEGTAAYFTKPEWRSRFETKTRQTRASRGFTDDNIDFYCLFEEAFPDRPRRHQMDPASAFAQLGTAKMQPGTIVIPCPADHHPAWQGRDFETAIYEIVGELAVSGQNIIAKPHPFDGANSKALKSCLDALAGKECSVSTASEETPLESLIVDGSHTLCLTGGSLDFYTLKMRAPHINLYGQGTGSRQRVEYCHRNYPKHQLTTLLTGYTGGT